MRITINDNNEITGYAIVGGIEGDFEIDDSIIPHDFTQNYKPKYYLYQNEQIIFNPNYEEASNTPYIPPMITSNGPDEELRKMFASMQEQLVQGNMMVAQVAQQNADLTQEIVNMTNEIKQLKGADKDEDVVSEI
ncbi:DUF2977 domain-containing protein [Staphylococcus kloosii]|uniref:DUF2977 domain-containing protein n=1 Tax=Staphylococcus kloosii TaxID=29384 RepID=A0ABQ0XIV6_9STAP|nr:DUF2977 domain-containing protein [Staphylococcus kloosii]AVQ36574.1 DUF2977 domain-containing protein [Staphylococcus kloosii]PNZ06349.1 hypothetical protein CD136_05520 [Staphylococcus kloosii]GEP81396.1 hypothetical protein SKL01_05740 [Staphylococcus kloosii]SUM49667.1 phage-like protein [Staphylococcus kloosii]